MSLMQWGDMLRTAARLGVPPESFWRMSVCEWRLLTGDATNAALSRRAFEALLQAHPDQTDNREKENGDAKRGR